MGVWRGGIVLGVFVEVGVKEVLKGNGNGVIRSGGSGLRFLKERLWWRWVREEEWNCQFFRHE